MRNVTSKKKWTPETIKLVSEKSLVDPRTIKKWLRGETVRTTIGIRIKNAAKQLGVPV